MNKCVFNAIFASNTLFMALKFIYIYIYIYKLFGIMEKENGDFEKKKVISAFQFPVIQIRIH